MRTAMVVVLYVGVRSGKILHESLVQFLKSRKRGKGEDLMGNNKERMDRVKGVDRNGDSRVVRRLRRKRRRRTEAKPKRGVKTEKELDP